jgi:hypothetical protein
MIEIEVQKRDKTYLSYPIKTYLMKHTWKYPGITSTFDIVPT